MVNVTLILTFSQILSIRQVEFGRMTEEIFLQGCAVKSNNKSFFFEFEDSRSEEVK